MTWGIFMNAIKEAELVNGTREQILVALFKNAGREKEFSEQAARKWISGDRNCKVSSYFSNGTITNQEGAYRFFRRRPEDKLKKLQQIFRSKKGVNSPIDCETENMDRFCWSLVNQFLDLLGFQRLELPDSDILQENSGGVAEDKVDGNADVGQNPEQVSFGGTPTEQMSKLFEQAVANYNIATYICKLSDYLTEEPFYAGDILAFVDFVQTNVLAKYVDQQNEIIYGNISEFSAELETYSGFLGMMKLSISEKYGIIIKMMGLNNEIISLLDADYEEVKNNLDEEISKKEDDANESAVLELKGKLTQLDILRTVLSSHKQLCDLFEEICPGKTIFVFQ